MRDQVPRTRTHELEARDPGSHHPRERNASQAKPSITDAQIQHLTNRNQSGGTEGRATSRDQTQSRRRTEKRALNPARSRLQPTSQERAREMKTKRCPERCFETLGIPGKKFPARRALELLPRVRSNGRYRASPGHLPQRRSHEVSSCPFRIDPSISLIRSQPSLTSINPCKLYARNNAVKHPRKKFV